MLGLYRFLTSTIGKAVAWSMIGRTPQITGDFRHRMGHAGMPADIPAGRRIWLNAASVGETMAAIPFVEEWKRRNPGDLFFVTNTTVTGYNRTEEKLAKHAHWHGFSPIDTPRAVRRYLDAIVPELYITVEAEAWPNLLMELGRRGVPRFLINGRMTLANKKGLKLRITSEVWNLFDYVIARSERDRDGYAGLGIPPEKLTVGGELKFDISFPEHDPETLAGIRNRYGIEPGRCWVAASTHEQEEELVLNVHKRILTGISDARLVLVPRRPERFQTVESIVAASGLTYSKLSDCTESCTDADGRSQVLIVDAMGRLLDFYQACGFSVVCGSFYGPGVHSVLEPAAYGKPTICGHRVFNTDIPERMARDGMLAIVGEPGELFGYVDAWYRGKPVPGKEVDFAAMGTRARGFISANHGSSGRAVEIVEKTLAKFKKR